MIEPSGTLRYLAFFETLAECEEESPLFHSTSAGLVTLRLVDGWFARGGTEPGGDQWSINAVRQQLELVPVTDPARSIMTGIVDEVARPGAADAVRVVPRLMAFGRALDFAGRWELAAELYEFVLAHVDARADSDLAISAQFRLAYCRRVLGQLDVAETAYVHAGELARQAGDVVETLRSEVGVAKVSMSRGNFPQAEQVLDRVIAKASADDTRMREFRATARHDRAIVAAARQDHEQAIGLLHLALADTHSPSARDRIIADIASSFMQIGVRDTARDGFLIVAATAEEQFSRWSATSNLMRLAADDGMEPVFEQYRRQLAGETMDPGNQAYYLYTLGHGFRLFGRQGEARTALAQAMAIAEEHGFNRIVHEADQELRALESGRQERFPSVAVPASITDAARTMRGLREAVLAVR